MLIEEVLYLGSTDGAQRVHKPPSPPKHLHIFSVKAIQTIGLSKKTAALKKLRIA